MHLSSFKGLQILEFAVQILTPCTTGNSWLKIFNFGLYAVSLYNKFNGEGVRVFLDVSKLDPYRERIKELLEKD